MDYLELDFNERKWLMGPNGCEFFHMVGVAVFFNGDDQKFSRMTYKIDAEGAIKFTNDLFELSTNNRKDSLSVRMYFESEAGYSMAMTYGFHKGCFSIECDPVTSDDLNNLGFKSWYK